MLLERARLAILRVLLIVSPIVGLTPGSLAYRTNQAPPACLTTDSSTLSRIQLIVSSTDTALGVEARQYDSPPNLPQTR